MTEPNPIRIVVADDDPDILDLVVIKLTGAGFDTVAVSDGVAALAAIEADPPRLAILDIKMPGTSGIDVLRQIRASQTLEDLDVILLSAAAGTSDVEVGLAAGATDYITKPFSPRELLEHVNALIKHHHPLPQIHARDLRKHRS